MQEALELLYIDDEMNNLIGFKANFRYSYTVHIATNTLEAESMLAANPNIRIIFCDQRMPGEQGIDFLSRIKNIFPKPIRILLTAFADLDTVISAINKGHIFRFVRKPWVEEEILSAIEEANQFYIANSLLEERNLELQTAYDELDKFAYSVSHDLRDPLTGVLSAINLGIDLHEVSQIHDLLLLMKDSVGKLDAYIQSLHNYYLLRRGELTLSEVDFHSFFDSIRKFYNIYTENTDVSFDIDIDQREPFIGDLSVIELVLHNLLSNAFKYQQTDSPNKSVRLSTVVQGGKATLIVKDTGIGISDHHINDIFKLFFRGSSQAQGMGFGLYNVQNALLKMQGTIDVQSQVGEGTTFTVMLPTKELGK